MLGIEHDPGHCGLRERSLQVFFPFEGLGVGTTKDQIFICDLTSKKCDPCGVAVLFLGEGVEVVTSQ